MHYTLSIILSMIMNDTLIIADFNNDSDLTNWFVVDDRVMGGVSQGTFFINSQGHATFRGNVSTRNNGGFSSIRLNYPNTNVNEYSSIVFRVKGDSKQYQLRVKSNSRDRQSYITTFNTSGQWETIEIKLSDLYPSFRGRKLNLPNYNVQQLNELSFLIGNKKEESFQLEIDWIMLK